MRIKASDGRMYNIPNDPFKAYIAGRQHGSQEQLDKTAMALLDKAGWHVEPDGPEDRQSIRWLYDQLTYYTEELKAGRITRRDIKDMLREESGIRFLTGGKEKEEQ
jgi:hypothetical protein